MQSTADGVVVVSFGSNVKYLPEAIVAKMVNIFGKRKELFLMRLVCKQKKNSFFVLAVETFCFI